MSHSPLPADRQRHSPTLWPRHAEGETSLELTIKARKDENSVLKNLVVKLSAIILRSAAAGK